MIDAIEQSSDASFVRLVALPDARANFPIRPQRFDRSHQCGLRLQSLPERCFLVRRQLAIHKGAEQFVEILVYIGHVVTSSPSRTLKTRNSNLEIRSKQQTQNSEIL